MIDFPANPTIGQIFSAGGATWKWDGTKWVYGGSSGSGGASITVSDTPPANPTQGALWWNSAQGQLYLWYVDPNTAQWVAVTNQMGGAYLPLTGGVMTGPIALSADPAANLQPVTLQYFNKYPMIGDNRLINGAMSVDQRNNGGSVAVIGGYIIDRWNTWASTTGKATAGRALSAASDLAATGFGYCFRYTSLVAYTVPATEAYGFGQPIEADLISDFAFGTAGAKPITLSFWVYCTVAGTFGGVIQSYATPYRSYPFTYSIPVANVWIKISITIPGDTGGSAVWPINGTAGAMYVIFDMGSGTSQRGPAGAWATATYNGATGTASLLATNGANFFITGVKLEIGNVATPFNQQTLSKIMSDCQRYYTSIGQAMLAVLSYAAGVGIIGSSMLYPTRMRAVPTVGLGTPTYSNASALGVNAVLQDSIRLQFTVTAAGSGWAAAIPLQLNAEL
jgi:hypothetical protein